MPNDIFISYASPNIAVARRICEALEGVGRRCWMAERDAIPGPEYPTQIVQAIQRCQLVVLVLSNAANDSDHVAREVELAGSFAKLILAVSIEPVKLSDRLVYFLSLPHRLDAIEPPFERHVLRLISAVQFHAGSQRIPALIQGRGEAQPAARLAEEAISPANRGRLFARPPYKRAAAFVAVALISFAVAWWSFVTLSMKARLKQYDDVWKQMGIAPVTVDSLRRLFEPTTNTFRERVKAARLHPLETVSVQTTEENRRPEFGNR